MLCIPKGGICARFFLIGMQKAGPHSFKRKQDKPMMAIPVGIFQCDSPMLSFHFILKQILLKLLSFLANGGFGANKKCMAALWNYSKSLVQTLLGITAMIVTVHIDISTPKGRRILRVLEKSKGIVEVENSAGNPENIPAGKTPDNLWDKLSECYGIDLRKL